MTTVVDYHYTAPSAYDFPARHPHHHHPPAMIKHHPQPLNLSSAIPRGLPTPYLPPPIPSPSAQSRSASTGYTPSNRRTNSTGSSSLHRSTSNGSSGSSNAYVTTLRKQKATVWCDRAQREDSRFLAAQKAAKAKAALEVARAAAQQSHHRTSESGSSMHRGKISHHRGGRKSNSVDHEFSTNRSLVAGVPARLDIDDDTSGDEQPGSGNGSVYGGATRRTNSGRSSINSTGQRRVHDLQSYPSYNATHSSSPSTYSRTSSIIDTALPEVPEPVENSSAMTDIRRNNSGNSGGLRHEYLPAHRKSSSVNRQHPSPNQSDAMLQSHQQSYSSEGYPPGFSEGAARPRPAAVTRAISSREPADLRRKGSIDDSRTTTMGRVRLFVANPDQ
ncbi:hypothetical protein TWF191_001278 [Orbilia oligospora]|uniref:Uncharacterized protein n=1 Tax=Orbilia oligospora TaxID=2813651 RepID=A0A7C8R0W3_ORBOL|nr:hypothetical protein TWF191_001278 [Orbilia oligospora]